MAPWNKGAGKEKLEESAQRIVILSVTMVGLLAALAALYQYYHLTVTDRLDAYTRTVIPTLAVFLAAIVSVVLISRGHYLKMAVWSVFALGSTHLLTTVTLALLVANDLALAAEHALWIIAVQVCLFATLERRVALALSTILFLLLAAICLAYCYVQNVSLIADVQGGFLVQLMIANGAILVLLGGLSAFREVALVQKTRAEASEVHAKLLGASAEVAIDERRKAMLALTTAEAAAKARESFLASMSHELRTPLNAIIGFAQVLEMDDFEAASPAAKRQEYATDIRNSGEHMLGLIGQILEFSRLESEGVDVNKTPQAIAQIAEASLRMIDVLARAKDINLIRTWDFGDDYVVRTDERALSQILVNLLSNAVKFTPQHGTISVSISRTRHGAVAIEVRDTGIGIPEEKVDLICDPFFQVGDQQTAGTEGTGLGLSIVNTLVAALGGSLEIKSVVGEGTCCRVKISSTPDASLAVEETDTQPAAPPMEAAS
ncbi:MAG: HAMP domain-containing histidine kinase [Rhodobiaceae bacterium]|nr:HAMP domain-containing histidine kinase [Rhodobiaceae bacterium]